MPPIVPGAPNAPGMDTRGAYGGSVAPIIQVVSSLADNGASTTLRYALQTLTVPRIIIFTISGEITLNSDIIVTSPYFSVYGQTAPNPGITIRRFGIQCGTHDGYFSHLRILKGQVSGDVVCGNTFELYGTDMYNIVLDHCNSFWGQDEGVLVFNYARPANVVIWRSIMAEGLNFTPGTQVCGGNPDPDIPGSGGHGLLLYVGTTGVSVIQSLFAKNHERNPNCQGGTSITYLNNVVYGWQGQEGVLFVNFSAGGGNGDAWQATVGGNRFIANEQTHIAYMIAVSGNGGSPLGNQLYRFDNTLTGDDGSVSDIFIGTGYDPTVGSAPSTAPMPSGYMPLPSTSVEANIVSNAGARPTNRDAATVRVLAEMAARSSSVGFVVYPSDVGGWPVLPVNNRGLTPPSNPHAVQASGYTALEEWLHTYSAAVEGAGGTTGDPIIPIATGAIVTRDSYSGTAGVSVTARSGEVGATWLTYPPGTGDTVLTGAGRARPAIEGVESKHGATGSPATNEYDILGSYRIMSDLTGDSHYASVKGRMGVGGASITAEYASLTQTLALYANAGSGDILLAYTSVSWGIGDHSIRLKMRASALAVDGDGVQLLYSPDTSVLTVGKAGTSFYSNPSNATLLSDTTGIQIDEILVTQVASGGITLSGVSAAGTIGAVGKGTNATLNGRVGTASIGSVSKAKSLSLLGLVAGTALGVFPGYVPAAPTVSGGVVVGLVTPFRSNPLSGFTNFTALGAVSSGQLGQAALSGVAATGTVQSLPFSKVTALTTVLATGQCGSVTALRDSAALTSIAATTAQGFVIAPNAATQALTSVFAVGTAEFVIPPLTILNPDTGELEAADYFTIAGTHRVVKVGWTITDAANNTGSMRFQVDSESGTYTPQIGDEVIYNENTVRIFGGYISSVLTSGAGGEGGTPLTHDVTALDYNSLASRRYWNAVMPQGTLKNVLLNLVVYIPGVTCDPAQVDGPTLDQVDYKGWKINAILNELTTRTSYVWEIDYYKVLRMYTPGTRSAPFSVTTANGKAKLDVSVEPDRSNFANHIIVYGTTATGDAKNDLSISLDGYYEALYSVLDTAGDNPVTYDKPALDAIAETILASSLPVIKTVKYNTLETGLRAGMSQFIDLPGRGIFNTFVITEVSIRYLRNLVAGRAVTCTEGLVYKNSWREVIKTWGGSQGGTTFSGGTGGGGTVTPAAIRNIVPLGGSGVDANSSPSAGIWVPVSGGGQTIGSSAVQPSISTIPRRGTDAIITARVKVLDPGNTVMLRLYDVTVGAACPGVSQVVSSNEWTTATPWGVQLTPGSHYYELEMLTTVVGSPVLVVAYLE